MKCENNIISINNTRDDWSNVLDYLKKENVENVTIHVKITSEHLLHNLIYYLLIRKKYKNLEIELVIYCDESLNPYDIRFEIDTLFFLVSRDIKKNIKINEVGKIATNFENASKLNVNTVLPFIFISNENELNELRKIRSDLIEKSKSYNKEQIKELANGEKPISFIENYIQLSITDPKNSEYKDFICKSSTELNLLALFILTYDIVQGAIDLDDLNDVKYALRNFSIALYQIIENSYYHSIGHFSISYFSILKLKEETKSSSYATVATKQLHKIQKMMDFIKEYNFDLNDEKKMFILTIDDCDQEVGNTILDNTNSWCKSQEENDSSLSHKEFSSLKETFLFYIEDQDESWEKYTSSSKYGIRTFVNSAIALNMQVMINSGGQALGIDPNCNLWKHNAKILELKNILVENETKYNKFVTEYACCLPIRGINRDIKNNSNNAIITREMISTKEILKYPRIDFEEKDFEVHLSKEEEVKIIGTSEKDVKVERISKNFFDKIARELEKKTEIIYTFHFKNTTVSNEILCKVLTKIIRAHLIRGKKFYLALNFVDEKDNFLFFRLSEFLYYFKISMNGLAKEKREKEIQSNVQIALFHSQSNRYEYISTIVGINYDIIMQSFINNLLYNNGIDTLDKFDLYIDDLDIFKYQKNSITCPISVDVLPFELLLIRKEYSMDPVFIRDLKNILKKEDLIKHENLNVLLGSGLYLDTFYEAEFIFQNNYIVKRIAFFIKNDIEDYITENQVANIVIVGYADYSHMLCEEISKMLRNDNEKAILSTLYVQNVGELKISDQYKEYNSDTIFISIVPIGSTLNTFLKMNLALKRYLKENDVNLYKFTMNYCVITVSPNNNSSNDYWKKTNSNEKIHDPNKNIFDILELNLNDNSNSIKIKSLVNLETTWKNFQVKSNDKNIMAISHVDRTSTIIKTIFKFGKEENQSVLDKDEFEKFKILRGSVSYGHYNSSSGNHHLFYINYKKIYEKEELKNEKRSLHKTLKKFYTNREELINPSAYNIVVAPLNSTNDLFLKFIIEQVFHNNATLLQFDLKNTFRENFKNKYSFVTKRLENIFEKSKSSLVNIYFVDNTIVSGRTLNRAKELVNSLLKESPLIVGRVISRIFTKAILFINRCSKNTLSSLMDSYENVIYYLDIKCPCFDTHSGVCPDCNISKNYEKLSFICTEDHIKRVLHIKAQEHLVQSVESIEKNQDTNKKNEDFLRLYYTHYILKNQKTIYELYDKSNDDIHEALEVLFDNCYKITEEILPEKQTQKLIFIKVLSRPFVTLYENIKQVCLKYLIYEFEKENQNLLSTNNQIDTKYLIELLTRISYMGSNYLNHNKEMMNNLKKNNPKDYDAIDKALYWEDAYFRGIIK